MKIREDEWLAELERLGVGSDADGMTVREIAAKMGCSITVARQRIAAAISAGKLAYRGTKATVRIDGRRSQAPVYG